MIFSHVYNSNRFSGNDNHDNIVRRKKWMLRFSAYFLLNIMSSHCWSARAKQPLISNDDETVIIGLVSCSFILSKLLKLVLKELRFVEVCKISHIDPVSHIPYHATDSTNQPKTICLLLTRESIQIKTSKYIYTVPSTNIGTLDKYEQRRL